MNHRVSIVDNTSTTESGLGSPEVCSKASCSCLSKSVFSKECVHCTFFFFLNHAQSLLANRLSCFVIVFLSRVNAQQWSRATQGSSTPVRESGVFFLLFFSFFFFSCQLTIHSRALRLSVCCELQAADEKKSDSPTPCVFAVVTVSAWRTNVWRRQIHEQNRTRRVPVHLP